MDINMSYLFYVVACALCYACGYYVGKRSDD